MKIGAHGWYGFLAAGVFALLAASAQRLVAQGGEKAKRSVGSTAALAPTRAHLEPARGMLHALVGTWRFEIWFAGNFGDAPDASGTRIVRALFDDLRLEWTEALDHSEIRGQGLIGFDATSDRFFSSSVYTAGPAPEFLAGILDDAEPRIAFSPLSLSADANPGQVLVRSSTLTILDRDHFTWTALDRGWRALFTRQATPASDRKSAADDP